MPSDLTDVRAEDSFDVAAVHTWLASRVEGLAALPTVMQYRSGASNLTYLLKYPDRNLVLRKPPSGKKASSAHDMKREYSIQLLIHPTFPLAPTVLAFCDDHSIIGADFYVMSEIPGTILRGSLPNGLVLSEMQAAQLADSMIEGLVALHSVDPEVLHSYNRGPGYVRRQVEGWSKRFRDALTDDVPDGEELMRWLNEHQPDDVALRVIHGDWRLDNMVFDFTSQRPLLRGVLDWELATVGDPLMDLGSALAYWVNQDDELGFASLRRQPSDVPGMPARDEIVDRYLELSGFPCGDFTFYEVFGLFRLSVIIQQIWARFRLGQTTNPAFADFSNAVHVLIHRAMERSS